MASLQPQLEALRTAMAQKGVSPEQMTQLQDAMNTIQALAGRTCSQQRENEFLVPMKVMAFQLLAIIARVAESYFDFAVF